MTQTLFQRHQSAIIDREASAATTSPSFYDADQFYGGGGFVGATVAGNAFTVPAGLKVGWKCRFYRDDTAGPMTIALDGSYSSLRPVGVSFPLSLLPGGFVELEIVATNRVAIGAYQGLAAATGSGSVATRTALAALDAASRYDGQVVMVRSDNSLWRFDSASAAAADYTGDVAGGAVTSANLVIVPTAGTGRWIRADKAFVGRWAFQNATPDNTALLTVPAGMALRGIGLPYFDFTTVVAGDGNRRVGASGSFGAFGGNAGDFIGSTAPAAGPVASTVGADFAAADVANTSLGIYQTVLIRAGETVTYDLVAAGAAGAAADGMICVPVALELGAGVMIS